MQVLCATWRNELQRIRILGSRGMTNMEAIISATRIGGELLGINGVLLKKVKK